MTSRKARERANTIIAKGYGAPSALTPEVQNIICAHMQIGGYLEDAAALAGVDVTSINNWLGTGKAELERRAAHEAKWGAEVRYGRSPTAEQRRERFERKEAVARDAILRRQNENLSIFFLAVTKASSTGASAMLATITRAATGQHTIATTTTTRKLADGTVETTTIEKKAEPDWQAAAWRLERRFPARWGRAQKMDVTGVVGVGAPGEEKVESAREWVMGKLARLAEAVPLDGNATDGEKK
jgi:hypothetical protein